MIGLLEDKNARYSEYNHRRVEKRASKLEETGQFRGMEDMGRKCSRGFKPRFGEVRQLQEVQDAMVVDDRGKDHLNKFALPVADTTNNAGPRRIEQRGSQLTDATRRARLQPDASELVDFLR